MTFMLLTKNQPSNFQSAAYNLLVPKCCCFQFQYLSYVMETSIQSAIHSLWNGDTLALKALRDFHKKRSQHTEGTHSKGTSILIVWWSESVSLTVTNVYANSLVNEYNNLLLLVRCDRRYTTMCTTSTQRANSCALAVVAIKAEINSVVIR